MPRVKAGDINIHYEVHGQGEPLVLLMGLGCPGALWLYQVEEFARKYRVIVFDNRGVGRTDKPAIDYSIEMLADDTAHLLRTLGVERAHILGMSMGGMIAQRLAINYPQIVDRLILACQTHSTTQELPRIKARTLVLVGDRDIQTPVGASKLISQSIPGSELVVLKGCGHGFMWEVPQSFNEAVLDFLQAP